MNAQQLDKAARQWIKETGSDDPELVMGTVKKLRMAISTGMLMSGQTDSGVAVFVTLNSGEVEALKQAVQIMERAAEILENEA